MSGSRLSASLSACVTHINLFTTLWFSKSAKDISRDWATDIPEHLGAHEEVSDG